MRKSLMAATMLAALIVPALAQNADTTTTPLALKQGWSTTDREWFYGFTQGSQVIPYDWFLALEIKDGTGLFRADGLSRFGYLPRPLTPKNPDALPVGFGIDEDKRGLWLGMNCSACHVNRVAYGGHVYQVDGAPGGGDLYAFISAVADSLDATVADPAKFQRFYNRIHVHNPNLTAAALKAQLVPGAQDFRKFVTQSTPNTPWGPARTDAFGMIFNRVTAIDLNNDANSRLPTAPVSLPFLWTTSRQDKTQWNGMVPNATWYERLARNVGQVLGVFGKIPGLHDKDAFAQLKLRNTVHTGNLLILDERIKDLTSPGWIGPAVSASDPVTLHGKQIYQQQCASCHIDASSTFAAQTSAKQWPCPTWQGAPKVSDDILPVCMIAQSDVGTDGLLNENAFRYSAETGVLDGWRPIPFVGPDALGSSELRGDILGPVVIGSILNPAPIPANPTVAQPAAPDSAPLTTLAIKATVTAVTAAGVDLYIPNSDELTKMIYKGGPLNGIWATAPYLHNGSVPSLMDLLKPVAQRPSTFWVGSRDLDAINVGFDQSKGRFQYDTTKPGNSNAGHTYGTTLSDQDKAALVQYLKTL